MVEDAVARGALKRVLPSWEATPLDPHLAYPSREQQPARVRKFIEHLTEARSRLKKVVAWWTCLGHSSCDIALSKASGWVDMWSVT